MRRMIYLLRTGLLLIGLSILSIVTVYGQCTVYGTDLGTNLGASFAANFGSEDGQSFTACLSGNITSISIRTDDNNTYAGSVNLWIVPGTPANGAAFPGFPVYQTFNVAAGGNIVTINLNTPFPVVAGDVYSIGFGRPTAGADFFRVNVSTVNSYFGGLALGTGGPNATADINFSVTIVDTSIPTLSQWGLIIFGLLVLNLGLVFVYKKQLITTEASLPETYIPLIRSTFSKYFIIALSIIGVGFIIARTLFGYELMTFDVPGSVMTAGLLAYLIQITKQ